MLAGGLVLTTLFAGQERHQTDGIPARSDGGAFCVGRRWAEELDPGRAFLGSAVSGALGRQTCGPELLEMFGGFVVVVLVLSGGPSLGSTWFGARSPS